MTYADTAVTRPVFARELPRLVAEMREIFNREEITHYLDHLERVVAIKNAYDEYDNGDFFGDSLQQLAAKRNRLAQQRELRTATALGTA
jgi:hypothetical protein